MFHIRESPVSISDGVDRLNATFQRMFDLSSSPHDPYSKIIWHVIQSGETGFARSAYQLPHGVDPKDPHEMARRTIQYEMERLIEDGCAPPSFPKITTARKQPVARVMSGLFISRIGHLLDDLDQRRLSTARIALWVSGQGRLADLVHAVYDAIKQQDRHGETMFIPGLREAWTVSQHVLSAAHHTFSAPHDAIFAWQEPLLLDTLIAYCAHTDLYETLYHYSATALHAAGVRQEYW